MSFRNIRVALMAAISEQWRDPTRDRPIIESLPVVRALLPVIDKVHLNLINKQNLLSVIEAEIKSITQELTVGDRLHDRKMRAAHQILSGFAEGVDDPELAAAILKVRDRLMPEGLMATKRPYLEEAGDARLVWGRLDEPGKRLLESLPTPEGTVADMVHGWVDAALRIEVLEKRRLELSRQRGSEIDLTSPGQARSATNAWIRMARTLEANLEIDPEATDEIKERLLGPLYRAEAIADRRYGNSGSAEEDLAFLHSNIRHAGVPFALIHSRLGHADVPLAVLHSNVGHADVAFAQVSANFGHADVPLVLINSRLAHADVPLAQRSAHLGHAGVVLAQVSVRAALLGEATEMAKLRTWPVHHPNSHVGPMRARPEHRPFLRHRQPDAAVSSPYRIV